MWRRRIRFCETPRRKSPGNLVSAAVLQFYLFIAVRTNEPCVVSTCRPAVALPHQAAGRRPRSFVSLILAASASGCWSLRLRTWIFSPPAPPPPPAPPRQIALACEHGARLPGDRGLVTPDCNRKLNRLTPITCDCVTMDFHVVSIFLCVYYAKSACCLAYIGLDNTLWLVEHEIPSSACACAWLGSYLSGIHTFHALSEGYHPWLSDLALRGGGRRGSGGRGSGGKIYVGCLQLAVRWDGTKSLPPLLLPSPHPPHCLFLAPHSRFYVPRSVADRYVIR